MKNNRYWQSLLVIVVICLVIAIAMAAINLVTAPKIEEANRKAEEEALFTVLESAQGFEQIDIEPTERISAIYRDTGSTGFVAMLSAKGYDSSNPMKIAVGFDNDGKILKCFVVSCSGETTGIGTKVSDPSFLEKFVGVESPAQHVDAISGATISSSAFIAAVQEAYDVIQNLREVGA